MLDKLLEFLSSFWDKLLPFQIIEHYNRGVRLRFGKKYNGILEPGLHWKIPFFDNIYEHLVKMTTLDLEEQTVTTKNGISIVVKGVIKYEVFDPITLLLEVNSATDALKDMSKGIIRDIIITRNYEECNDAELSKSIAEKIKNEAKQWGIKVLKVTLTDLAKMTSIRLLTSNKAVLDVTMEHK